MFSYSKNKLLLWLILLIIALVPKALSSIYQVGDPFAYSTIATSQMSINSGHIAIHPFEPIGGTLQLHANALSERSAVTSLLVVISQVLNLPINGLIFIPLNGVIFLILSYALARSISKSALVSIFFTLFIAYEPALNVLSYNIFYIGIGFSLFFTFIILLLSLIKEYDSKKTFLILLIFISICLTYYTSIVNSIIFSLIFSLFFFFSSRMKKIKLPKANWKALILISVIFITVFIGFDTLFYSYFTTIMSTNSLDFVSQYLSYIQSIFTPESSNISANKTEVFTANIGLFVLVSIITPIFLYLLLHLIRLFRRLLVGKEIRLEIKHVIYLAFIVPWLVDIIIYSSLEVFPFKLFLLLFSFLAFFSINEIIFQSRKIKRKKQIAAVFMLIVISLGVVKFGAWFTDPKLGYAVSYDSSISPTSSWLSHHASEGGVLADLKTSGRLLVDVTETKKADALHMYIFTKNNVPVLYSNNATAVKHAFRGMGYDYLVLSYKSVDTVIEGANWLNTRPLGEAFNYFENYTCFNRVYDDKQGLIYKYLND